MIYLVMRYIIWVSLFSIFILGGKNLCTILTTAMANNSME
nr:MAG TPA: hypothetical protein [Caudoviricetes sp.]